MQQVIDSMVGEDTQAGAVKRFIQKLRPFGIPTVVLGVAVFVLNEQAVLRDIGFIEFDTLLVTGNFEFVETAKVREVASAFANSGFLQINLAELRDAIQEIDWVHDAKVRREWPATLVVEIVEESPVAIWRNEKLLNANGRIFGQASHEFDSLPRLAGPEGTQTYLLNRYVEFKSSLGGTALDFEILSLSKRRSFELETISGIRVILGSEEIDQRMQRLANQAARIVAENSERIEVVDLRYSNGFAIKFREKVVDGSATNQEDELNAQEI